MEELKKDFCNLEKKKTIEMNHYRKLLYENIQEICQYFTSKQPKYCKLCQLIILAAASHTFQGLMKFDEAHRSTFEEIDVQINIYRNEVFCIHQLLKLKGQNCSKLFDEKLNDYIRVM